MDQVDMTCCTDTSCYLAISSSLSVSFSLMTCFNSTYVDVCTLLTLNKNFKPNVPKPLWK